VVERCPDKTEVVGSIPTTRTRRRPFVFMEDNKKTKIWWQPALVMFAKSSAWIAIPVICALFIGKYLDKRYGTDPWIFLILTGIAFLVSMLGIWKILKKYINDIEKHGKSN
jgi:hypothetical protein